MKKLNLPLLSFVFLFAFVCCKFATTLSTGLGNYYETEWAVLTTDISSLSLLGLFSLGAFLLSLYKGREYSIRGLDLALVFLVMLLVSLAFIEGANFQFRYILIFSSSLLMAMSLKLLLKKEEPYVAFLSLSLLMLYLGFKQSFSGLEKDALLLDLEGQYYLAAKLREGLMFGPFSYSNQFASFLLLILPSSFYFLSRDFLKRGHVLRVVSIALGLSFLSLFLMTRSKTAFLALLLTALFFVFKKADRKQKVICGVLSTLALALSFFVLYKMGKLASAATRYHYYKAAIQMFWEHPLKPLGLGAFYPEYMRLKAPGIEETRFPHSIFFALISQFGIWGLILYGFIVKSLIQKMRQEEGKYRILLFSLVTWFIHAHFDYVIYSPASLVTVFLISLIVYEGKAVTETNLSLSVLFSVILLLGLSFVSIYQFLGEQKIAGEITRIKASKGLSVFELKKSFEGLENSQLVPDPDLIDYFAQLHLSYSKYYLSTKAFLKAQQHLLEVEKLSLDGLEKSKLKHVYCRTLAEVYHLKGAQQEALKFIGQSLVFYPYSTLSLNMEKKLLAGLERELVFLNDIKLTLLEYSSLSFQYKYQRLNGLGMTRLQVLKDKLIKSKDKLTDKTKLKIDLLESL